MHDYAKIAAWKQKERAEWVKATKRPKKSKRSRKKAKRRKLVPVNAQGYPANWTPRLRHYVRQLHGWQCAWCGKKQRELGDRVWLHVHHKDKNKRNCRIGNLVPLCPDCHVLVAHGGYWSDLRGDELCAATAAQKAKIAAWKKVRKQMKDDAKEYAMEETARKMGLAPPA